MIQHLAGLAQKIRYAPLLRNQKGLWNLLRGPYRAMIAAASGSRGMRVRINGEPDFEFHLAGVSSRVFPYEPECWNAVRARLKPGMKILDVGAHQGLYSLTFSRCVGPEGRVWSFEPNPLARERLTANIRSNGFEATDSVEPLVCGDADGEITFRFVPDADIFKSGFSSVIADIPELERTKPTEIKCRATRLDTFCSERGITPDAIKVDVEGFEWAVLRGAGGLLDTPGLQIFCEVHTDKMKLLGESSREMIDWMRTRGFRVASLTSQAVESDPLPDTVNVLFARD